MGVAARARLGADARVIAVTGSAGKTGTKEMLRACLARCGKVHASERSYNNHLGVPLTLARMPADARYAVFEIGMNHAGEITPLTRMVRPHVAIITTVEAVHLGHFRSVEDIADAKAEIMHGLEPGGTAILNRDNPHFARLLAIARGLGVGALSFGHHAEADIRPATIALRPDGSDLTLAISGRSLAVRVGAPGAHLAINALAVAAAVATVGADPATALAGLSDLSAPAGRGARTLLAHGHPRHLARR